MINRVFKQWNWRRILYLGMGIFITIQAVIFNEWPGIIIGLYFASMGLFAFGCAGNHCMPYMNKDYSQHTSSDEKVIYEEIKNNN